MCTCHAAFAFAFGVTCSSDVMSNPVIYLYQWIPPLLNFVILLIPIKDWKTGASYAEKPYIYTNTWNITEMLARFGKIQLFTCTSRKKRNTFDYQHVQTFDLAEIVLRMSERRNLFLNRKARISASKHIQLCPATHPKEVMQVVLSGFKWRNITLM